MAHRRQYAKSRRLASSFLRSQFVRYDSFASTADRWYQVHTFDGAAEHDELGHWTKFESADKSSLAAREPQERSRSRDREKALKEQAMVFANYSSSSLDSFSLPDATCALNRPTKQQGALNASPLASTAKSLSFLPNLILDEATKSAERSANAHSERVVRSETIDLNQVNKWHQSASKSTFFAPFQATNFALKKRHQLSHLDLTHDDKLSKAHNESGRFISMQRLANQTKTLSFPKRNKDAQQVSPAARSLAH